MSTTTNLKVALEYASSASSLVLKVNTSNFMNRGVDISWCSAFPGEEEYLYPPLTFLQPTGNLKKYDANGCTYTFVEVTPTMA